jgi:flagellar L-ring protein precursor FlgH
MRNKLLLGFLFLAAASSPGFAQRPGSIYDPQHGPYGLIAQKTAYRKGDLVTVVISETQQIQNQESSDLAKATNLNYKINVWDIAPDMFDPLPAVDADSTDNFVGSAKRQKSGQFSARLAAIVIDTLPNGNLVVSGRREIRVDKEVKVMEFTGIVRRLDITAQNTIQSELVANAEVVYRGSGPLTDSTQRYGLGGWLHRAWAWVWPF